MNAAQWRYYALNQHLLGRSFDSLPADAQNVMSSFEASWKKTQSAPTLRKLTSIEETFLSLLRLPDYGLCISTKKSIIEMGRLIELVREHDLEVENCSQWASALVSNVNVVDIGEPCVKDGVLYLSEQYLKSNVDLDTAMKDMFALRCWGDVNPSKDLKDLVKLLTELQSPSDDITVSDNYVSIVFKLYEKAGVAPTTLSRTALLVSDLSVTRAVVDTVAWWSSSSHASVSMMLPRGQGDKLAHAKIPTEEFLKMCASGKEALSSLRVQGQKILAGDEAV